MEEFHLDARSKIGGPPTSCSQPEQRSLFLRPKNKIPLHGIFTGEDESTKISRSCSPSMFMGRMKPHFSNATTNSSQDKETTTTNSTTTKENEAEEEESKEELFAVESYVVFEHFHSIIDLHLSNHTFEHQYRYSADLQTPIKSQNSGLLHEILSTPDGREKDEDWFHKSEDFDPTDHTNKETHHTTQTVSHSHTHEFQGNVERVRLFLPSAVRKLAGEIKHGTVNAVRLVFRLNRRVKQDPL